MASHQNLEIVPSNVTSDGTLSFHNGQPVIQFIIGEQERYLLGQSVRLVGNFSVLSGEGALGSANAQLNIDGRTSLYSTIDQLVIKSQATNQTIEHIRNYNRFMSSYLSTTNDLGDGLSHLNESGLQVLNNLAIKEGVVDNQNNLGVSSSFALSLPCGFLNGTANIPLAKEWGVGGIILEIHLSPDNNVLFSNDQLGTSINNSYYEYKNMYLSCEVERPAPEQLASIRNQGKSGNTFEYNSISSYYTTINSSNAIINFSLGLSRVLSVFCNFITSSYINNRGYNGMSTWYPTNAGATNPVANVEQLIFTRGGERLPLEYNIDTIQRNEPNNRFPYSQILRNYVNAVQSFPQNRRNTLKPENNIRSSAGGTPAIYQNYIDGGSGFGIGVAFDSISNQGLDFTNTNLGINIDLGLVTDNPQSVFMFIHSKRSLVFNPSGIQVLN
tara:strand:+ start:206 stop:1531 length:1326 start_codon:yes stop_codon:yes gene_type:complete